MIIILVFMFFFFSSRRRHTRCLSDWSSDVCPSDLTAAGRDRRQQLRQGRLSADRAPLLWRCVLPATDGTGNAETFKSLEREIGRASCRERVEVTGGAGCVRRKNKTKRDCVCIERT